MGLAGLKNKKMKKYSQSDLEIIERFIADITEPLPIQLGTNVRTYLGDGVVIAQQVNPNKYNVNMIHKGYDQVFDISELASIDTIATRYSPEGWLTIVAAL